MANAVHDARTGSTSSKTGAARGGRPQRLWIVIIAVAVVIALVAVGGYVVWDRNFRTAGSANPQPNCPVIVPAGHRPPLAMPGVDRVTLIGDSIMDQSS